MADQRGSPERESDVTAQFRAAAARQMREPRKPVPPQTTSFRLAVAMGARRSERRRGSIRA